MRGGSVRHEFKSILIVISATFAALFVHFLIDHGRAYAHPEIWPPLPDLTVLMDEVTTALR
jgi:hypothetical protein